MKRSLILVGLVMLVASLALAQADFPKVETSPGVPVHPHPCQQRNGQHKL